MAVEAPPLTARAVALGERIDVAGLERRDALSATPLALRLEHGLVVVFRYGVVVLMGVDPGAEDTFLRHIAPRVSGALADREEEVVPFMLRAGQEEGVGADGAIRLADLSLERLLLVADALAKSTALAVDERRVAGVLDTVEPWAQQLATAGRNPRGRRRMLRQVGSALLAQHRLSQRVAAREKPDILWDRPDLERLYARLVSEYELVERADAVDRKLDLVGKTVTVLTDLIDTERALRLEAAIVALIVAEIALTWVEKLPI